MTPDLTTLLTDAAEPVVERDFVDRALSGAERQRRRTRWVSLAAAAAVAAVLAALLVPRSDDSTLVPARPSPSSSAWHGQEFGLLGVTAQEGPQPDQVRALPPVTDVVRSRLSLPERLGWPAGEPLPSASLAGRSTAPLRAVMLSVARPSGYQVVLYRPAHEIAYTVAKDLDLAPVSDASGNAAEPLTGRAIASDRRRVAFPQPGKVVLLDAVTEKVTSIPIPDAHLFDAGWSVGDTAIVARSESATWLVDPVTHTVRRTVKPSYAGRSRIVPSDAGMQVQRFDGGGSLIGGQSAPDVLADTWGETVSNLEGWVASGGFLTQSAKPGARGAYQGVFVIQGDIMDDSRILLAPTSTSAGLSKGCCRALGWGPQDQLLVQWDADLLAWDVTSGALARVGSLPVRGTDPGSPSGAVALAP